MSEVAWPDHMDALDQGWEPGQHASVIAPTGEGKSWILRHLLELWTADKVLVVDNKGDDELWRRGDFLTVHSFPTWWQQSQQRRRGREWYHLVTPDPMQPGGWQKAREVVAQALRSAYRQGDWVIVLDETRAVTDRRHPGLGLDGYTAAIWLRGRSRRVTLIAATQAPRWVPSSFYDQPRRHWIGFVQDARARKRLEEIGGNTDQLLVTIDQLQEHQFAYVTRRQMYVVKAPEWMPLTLQQLERAQQQAGAR